MRIQMGVNWSQATGTMSHTIPQLSQLALWVLNSQNRKKSGPQCPQNRHFGGATLPGPLMCIQMGLNWTESEMDITFSNDNINWFKRPYTKSKLFSRLSNLYEFNKKVKTRFIKLNNFKNPRNLTGIQNIEIFNKTYENI